MSRRGTTVLKSRATTALAVWMTVLATSTSLVHAHSGPARVHDLGWLVLASESDGPDPHVRHRHRVILGVELPAEPCPEGAGDDPDCVATEASNVTIVVTVTFCPDDGGVRPVVRCCSKSRVDRADGCVSCSRDRGRHHITGVALL